MFNPSREDVRRFFFDTWSRSQAGQPLSDLERKALEVILRHPEYHPVLDAPGRYLDRDWTPDQGETNPFLHLSLHLAVEEQLSIDQPPGIQTMFRKLCESRGSEHDALHDLVECLAETVWEAQRHGTAPDGARYLSRVASRVGTDPAQR